MLSVAYSDLIESIVVRLPGPAIKGKATGKTVAENLLILSSSRKSFTPNTISIARKNKTNEPATANELTSIPLALTSHPQ